jgi:protein TonB
MNVTINIKLCALTTALLVHVLFVVSCAENTKPIGAAQDQGADGLAVGVGLAGSFNDSSPAVAQQEKSNDDTSDPAEIKEKKTPIVDPSAKEAAPIQQAEPATAPNSIEAKAVEKPAEETVSSKLDAPSQTASETPSAEPATQETLAAEKNQDTDEHIENVAPQQESKEAQTASIQATGTGNTQESGGNPAAEQNYLAKIQARLAKFKRYPRSARKENITGTVLVEFVLTGDGRIERPSIVRSSGDSRLDQEALDVLLRASPFPRIPKKLRKDSFALTLPVEFSLNQSRKLF